MFDIFETVIDTKRNAVVTIEHYIRTDSGVPLYIVHDEEKDDYYIVGRDHLAKYDKYYFDKKDHCGTSSEGEKRINELDKLREMLRNADIPFEDHQEKKPFYSEGVLLDSIKMYGPEASRYSRNHIIYGRLFWKFDAVFQYGSYCANKGLLETYGELGVDSDGEPRVMTAEQAFEIIKNDWEKEQKQ